MNLQIVCILNDLVLPIFEIALLSERKQFTAPIPTRYPSRRRTVINPSLCDHSFASKTASGVNTSAKQFAPYIGDKLFLRVHLDGTLLCSTGAVPHSFYFLTPIRPLLAYMPTVLLRHSSSCCSHSSSHQYSSLRSLGWWYS